MNNWLAFYGGDNFVGTQRVSAVPDDALAYLFKSALESRYPAAGPNYPVFDYEYSPVVKMEIKRGPSRGGCG